VRIQPGNAFVEESTMPKNRRFLRFVLPALASVPFLTFATSPAFADSPTFIEQHIVRPPEVIGDCDGHPVTAEYDFVRKVTIFYSDGTAVRQLVHAPISGTIRDTVTGASLTATGVRVIVLTPTGQFVSSTGTNVHVVVPGFGTVTLAAGHVGFDDEGNFFEHGRLDEPLTARLCDALAG
jgi:hypothetical protein